MLKELIIWKHSQQTVESAFSKRMIEKGGMQLKMKRNKKRIAVLTLCTVMAFIPVPVSAGGSVSGSDGMYKASCSGLTAGSNYTVTAVSGTLADYVLTDSHILFIKQIKASSSSMDVSIPLRNGKDAVVLLAGNISGSRSPEVIGIIENGAVSPHSYTVTCHEATCTEQGYRSYY